MDRISGYEPSTNAFRSANYINNIIQANQLESAWLVGWRAVNKEVIKEFAEPNQSLTSGNVNTPHELIRLQPCAPTMTADFINNSLSTLAANLMHYENALPQQVFGRVQKSPA